MNSLFIIDLLRYVKLQLKDKIAYIAINKEIHCNYFRCVLQLSLSFNFRFNAVGTRLSLKLLQSS